jgi:agmatinase
MKSETQTGLFGLPTERKNSLVVIQPIPWEVTTSYGSGTSRGPEAILEASPQLDLFDLELGEMYKVGYHLESIDQAMMAENDRLKKLANEVLEEWDEFGETKESVKPKIKQINDGCNKMVKTVYDRTLAILAEKKIPGLIGGDHSSPLGCIQAISDTLKGDFGVLHVDAHADLRLAYQGYTHSHASIMRNVMLLKTPPKKLVQVAIRDFCKEEYDFIQESEGRIQTFFDEKLKTRLLEGESWDKICKNIIENLPKNVYISFDIDGLSPEFCPSTGTPVPGGLNYDQAVHLIKVLGQSGRKIVGFDLNEVAPNPDGGEWDGNVGARLLFKLCGWTAHTNGGL